ncbi:hypothetical protein MTR67_030974 [Solanum verrucosum]|uniref:Uncharacterized protein n=1 Tax=Solanum verrucosum TaxID=315347 RepID=A0AAF0U1L9_SOLVR|nr:hypothetical protein MTR67_030974 [Solanum verrucosum]
MERNVIYSLITRA